MDRSRTIKLFLIGLAGLYFLAFAIAQAPLYVSASENMFPNGSPLGGDFINQWSAAQLALAGRIGEIYAPDLFMAFERTLTGAPIGYRTWAYPPHSLLMIWPFGLMPYRAALLVWSMLGLAVLAVGARRCGFGWLEILVLVTSPASVLCLHYGQTGNLGTGLLLLALSPTRGPDGIGAAGLLTAKPQMGFLLPFFWLKGRRWPELLWTSLVVMALVGLSLVIFGVASWRDYLELTLPGLSALERHGTGQFMLMIPSAFMAFRIISGDGDLAITLHAGFALVIALIVLWRLFRLDDPVRQTAVVLLGTVLITPYLHNYDLGLLLAGALLVLHRHAGSGSPVTRLLVVLLVGAAWALPHLVMVLNGAGLPLSPLLILPLLFLA